MVKQPSISNAAAIAACNAIVDKVDDPGGDQGRLRIYGGTQPADTDTPVTSQPLLVDFQLPWPAFGNAQDASPKAVAVANSIPNVVAVGSGTATWFRVVTKSGVAVFDGNVGVVDEDCIVDNTTVQAGQTVQVLAIKYHVRET